VTDQTTADTTRPIVELFRSDCTAFWATTFNIDLAFFNEYLLRRLGDPPLNAVVLADQDCLDMSLERAAERPELLESVNRRWLLRGVSLGSGRFHPKSYLAVHGRTATLTIGSGNLSRYGIDQGREVFVSFRSGTAVGDATIATWRQWMRQLVTKVADTTLAERFTDLEERLPPTQGLQSVAESPLLHNLHQPLLDQFIDAVGPDSVDELLVTAPFYDENAAALGQIVDALRPQRISVYVTTSTSVNGASLRDRLERSMSEISIHSYVPDEFTHAKLVGITRNSTGWIMSGSANLSHAALTLRADPGNVELAVVANAPADVVRGAFIPPDTTVELTPIHILDSLHHRSDPITEGAEAFVRLQRVTLLADGRMYAMVSTGFDQSWSLSDGMTSHSVTLDSTNPQVATVPPGLGLLVRLTTDDGSPTSNWCLVDDPVALASALVSSERKTQRTSPAELTAGDLETPLGRALLFMHQNMVMDVSELTTGVGSEGTEPDESQPTDDDIWQRLERERLHRDPRAAGYHRLLNQAGAASLALDDQIVDLLEAMRLRVPANPQPTGGSLLLVLTPTATAAARESHPWSTSARVRVRARNVLRRWAVAQTDVRLAFVDPLAPLVNLLHITVVLLGLWPSALGTAPGPAELEDDDLQDLWAKWFQPIVGTGNNDGWLDRVDPSSDRYRRLVTDELSSNITALCWLAIRSGAHRRERTIEWQPYLRAAFEHDLINDSPDVAAYLSAATATAVTSERVADDLLRSLEFIDDELWCTRMATEFGLTAVELTAPSAEQRVSLRLGVGGIAHPLLDPRLPPLILRACHYRRSDAIAIYSLDHSWRLVMDRSEPAAYKATATADVFEGDGLTLDQLEQVAADAPVLARWFPAAVRAA
jgi:hypothetical protein